MPWRSLPWTWFVAELAALAALLVAMAAAVRQGGALPLPRWTLAAALLALVPWAQWAAGQFPFLADAALPSLYLLAFAAAAACGHALVASQQWFFIRACVAAVALAGLGAAGMALWQAFGGAPAPPWLHAASLPTRATANLGQPNLLATLLVWSLIAWLGLMGEGRWCRRAVVSVAVVLAAALVCTRSLTGWLELVVVALAVAALPVLRKSTQGLWPVLLALPFATLAIAWWGPLPLNVGAVAQPAPLLDSRSARLAHWQTLAGAVWDRPLSGWGFNQVTVAYASAPDPVPAGELVDHAHNLVLDLTTWTGMPITLLVLVGLGAWIAWVSRRARSAGALCALLALATWAVHTMLEFPHAYLAYLLPVGAVAGGLSAAAGERTTVEIPEQGARALMVGAVAITAVVVLDYARVEALHARVRPMLPSVAAAVPAVMPVGTSLPRWLDHQGAYLAFHAGPIPTPLDERAWATAEQVSLRFGDLWTLLRWTRALVAAGRLEDARQQIDRLCRTHSPSDCAASRVLLAQWVSAQNLPRR
jgi:O-antigen ligase